MILSYVCIFLTINPLEYYFEFYSNIAVCTHNSREIISISIGIAKALIHIRIDIKGNVIFVD